MLKGRTQDNKATSHLLFVAVFSLPLAISGVCTISSCSYSEYITELNASIASAIDFLQQNDDTLQVEINSVTPILSGLLPSIPATSCLQISLCVPSGYYWVTASNGSVVRVYCDMATSCGDGGWMRVASLDFSNASTSCPSGLLERVDSGIRTCGKSSGSVCPSVMLSTSGVEYTKVCGKILAYQFGSPNGFSTGNDDIDGNYVDGVSLTHGDTPRNHIWTFVAARDEFGSGNSGAVCQCSHTQSGVGMSSPSFVGEDYFCDSGIQTYVSDMFFPDDPLWDGSGCGSSSTCCSFNTPPWFIKELPSPTSDDIEMRVCSDEDRSSEDIAMSSVEIYIQ